VQGCQIPHRQMPFVQVSVVSEQSLLDVHATQVPALQNGLLPEQSPSPLHSTQIPALQNGVFPEQALPLPHVQAPSEQVSASSGQSLFPTHFTQVPAVQNGLLPEQSPFPAHSTQVPAVQTGLLPEQSPFLAHSTQDPALQAGLLPEQGAPLPQVQVPLEQESVDPVHWLFDVQPAFTQVPAWQLLPLAQVAQAAPPLPQASLPVPVLQVAPAQHPVGHVLALHGATHAPLTQVLPPVQHFVPHFVPVLQAHFPLTQARSPLHLGLHCLSLAAAPTRGAFSARTPLPASAASRTASACRRLCARPSARNAASNLCSSIARCSFAPAGNAVSDRSLVCKPNSISNRRKTTSLH
jgi:hypothetical protein